MTSDNNRARSLREIELETLEEGREWTRQRLEQKLQAEADRQGGVFPPCAFRQRSSVAFRTNLSYRHFPPACLPRNVNSALPRPAPLALSAGSAPKTPFSSPVPNPEQ